MCMYARLRHNPVSIFHAHAHRAFLLQQTQLAPLLSGNVQPLDTNLSCCLNIKCCCHAKLHACGLPSATEHGAGMHAVLVKPSGM